MRFVHITGETSSGTQQKSMVKVSVVFQKASDFRITDVSFVVRKSKFDTSHMCLLIDIIYCYIICRFCCFFVSLKFVTRVIHGR